MERRTKESGIRVVATIETGRFVIKLFLFAKISSFASPKTGIINKLKTEILWQTNELKKF